MTELERLELKITPEIKDTLGWLKKELNCRSNSEVVRLAIVKLALDSGIKLEDDTPAWGSGLNREDKPS